MLACMITAVALLGGGAARAADKPAGDEAKKPAPEPPKAEQSVTQHSVVIGGKTIDYTATAGTLIVRNDKDEPTAAIGYIAYTLRGAGDPGRRPITFAYNGGPGSSAVWLHMGALGPRRIVTTDAGPTPPAPYRVVDNGSTLPDTTRPGMIRPRETGVTRAVAE